MEKMLEFSAVFYTVPVSYLLEIKLLFLVIHIYSL